MFYNCFLKIGLFYDLTALLTGNQVLARGFIILARASRIILARALRLVLTLGHRILTSKEYPKLNSLSSVHLSSISTTFVTPAYPSTKNVLNYAILQLA